MATKIDNRYVVIKKLGSGLSGEVIAVKDGVEDRALKLLNRVQLNVSKEDALKNFKNEFSILSELNHPGIGRILDFGFDSSLNKYYFTTELISGTDFFSASQGKSLEQIEGMAVQIMRALNYLHSRNIYHLDIKPQNILVTEQKEADGKLKLVVKIIDFGLAGFSSPRKKVGTPSYMAPEVVLGGTLDGRTDLYSFGVVLTKVLTRENPFASKDLNETLLRHRTFIPRPASEVNPELPKFWDRILARLLEKSPSDRYPNGSAVIRDINFLAGKNYEIETIDTRLSYLPEKGSLIGRKKEVEIFKSLFDMIFFEDQGTSSRLLIVEGKLGTGKTRILSEFKYHSQLSDIPVYAWRTFHEPPVQENITPPFCLQIDEADNVGPDAVNLTLQKYSSQKILIIWATEQAPLGWSHCETISLKNFTEEEITQYLVMVTGLENPPHKLILEIFHRTDGNPLFVTELLKTMLANNLLLDSEGRWVSSTFEDIGINFEKIQIPKTLSGLLEKRYSKLDPSQRAILEWMAVFNRPLSLEMLRVLAKIPQPQAHLLYLTKEDLIERTDREHRYFFTNILLRGVIYESLPQAGRAGMHDEAAMYLQGRSEAVDEFLFHLGQGSHDERAVEALLSLGENILKKEKFGKAVDILEGAWERADSMNEEKKIEVEKALAASLISAQDYKRAAAHYMHLKEIYDRPPYSENLEERITIYEKTGDLYSRMDQYDKALALFEEATAWIPQISSAQVHHLLINNYKANVYMKSGRLEEAEKTFREAKKEWEELPLEEKKKVTNNWLIDLLILKRDFQGALKEIEHALVFFEQIADRYLMGRSYYLQGDIYSLLMFNAEGAQKTHYKDLAIASFEKCLKVAKEIDAYDLMLRTYNGIGNVHYYQDEFTQSTEDYERALALARKLEDLKTAAIISLNLGDIYKIQKKYRDAYAYLVYAINILENLPTKSSSSWHHLFKCYIEIADAFREMNEEIKAEEALEKAEGIMASHEHLAAEAFNVWFGKAKIFAKLGRADLLQAALKKAEATAQEQADVTVLRKFKELIKKEDPSSVSENLKSPPSTYKFSLNLKKMKEDGHEMSGWETIIQINKFLNSEHDPDHLLKIVLNFALELTGAESGLVLLVADDGNLEIKAAVNADVNADLKRISTSVAKKALETGEVVISADALSDKRFDSSHSVVLNELKSVLCMPLKSRNKTIGILYLDNRFKMNAFEKVEMTLLSAYCDQVGIALENARLFAGYQEAQNQLEEKLEKTTGELNEAREMLKTETSAYLTKYSYDQIIARSKPMREIFKVLDKITETNLSVCLHGASGTGKELIARALHYNNPQRASKRFVAINCGAIPASLIESELFGYKAGSFTGAVRDKKGLFEEAHAGTLLLDEVADLDIALQVRLLRVLQEGEVMRVGDVKSVKVDVRVVCASHKNLEEQVKLGKFREDLYYRLCQIKISLPPLSKRTEDIPLLMEHFIEKFREENKIREKIRVAPELMKAAFQYTWPGNIRELENLIHVACALRNGHQIDLASLPQNYGLAQMIKPQLSTSLATGGGLSPGAPSVFIDEKNQFDPSKTWEDYETLIIAKCFQSNGLKKGATSAMLGLSPSTLYKKLKEKDLENGENSLYTDPFIYESGATLKSYIPKIFMAALKAALDRPYTAIRQLNISQGYFYKVMKQGGSSEALQTVGGLPG